MNKTSNTSEDQTDIQAQLKAMEAISETLKALKGQDLISVIKWINSNFISQSAGESDLNQNINHPKKEQTILDKIEDLPSFLRSLNQKTITKIIMAIGFWLQIKEKQQDFSSVEIIENLAKLGRKKPSNTSADLASLKRQGFIMLTSSKKNTKRYKMTQLGKKSIEEITKQKNEIKS